MSDVKRGARPCNAIVKYVLRVSCAGSGERLRCCRQRRGLTVAAKVSDTCCPVRICPGQSTFPVRPVLARAGRCGAVRETIRETRGRLGRIRDVPQRGRVLRSVLVRECRRRCEWPGSPSRSRWRETIVHALVEASDGKQRNWFSNFLGCQSRYDVKLSDRALDNAIPLPQLWLETSECPACGEALGGAVEKGVDTALVTEFLSLASPGASVENVQPKDESRQRGLARHRPPTQGPCWANFELALN